MSVWGANSSLDVVGHSFGGRLRGRCGRVFFLIFVEYLRTSVTMLRLFTGFILVTVVVFDFTVVDVTVGNTFQNQSQCLHFQDD